MYIRLLFLLMLAFSGAIAQTTSQKIKVWGNCDMCKSRIEKAAKVPGVVSVFWGENSKILTVSYDSLKVNADSIQAKIAAAGHDTEKYRAPAEVYRKLPDCCLYERKEQE